MMMASTNKARHECCMCGDYGFSYELFQCEVCRTRSQHRYCSNLYPKAESYGICNWCLSKKEEEEEKSRNSSNSSSLVTNKTNDVKNHDHMISSIKKKNENMGGGRLIKGTSTSPTDRVLVRRVKKNRSPKASPLTSPALKRIVRGGGTVEEKLRRTKSEEISNRRSTGVTKHVIFRNKVRRYKLLEEVSS